MSACHSYPILFSFDSTFPTSHFVVWSIPFLYNLCYKQELYCVAPQCSQMQCCLFATCMIAGAAEFHNRGPFCFVVDKLSAFHTLPFTLGPLPSSYYVLLSFLYAYFLLIFTGKVWGKISIIYLNESSFLSLGLHGKCSMWKTGFLLVWHRYKWLR